MTASSNSRTAIGLGILFLLAAVLLNKWGVEQVFSRDAHIESLSRIAAIVAFEALLALTGVILLVRRPSIGRSGRPRAIAGLVGAGLVAVVAVGVYGNLKALRIIDPNREARIAWETMIASEELIVQLNARLSRELSESAKNLELPDHLSLDFFDAQIAVKELEPRGVPQAKEPISSVDVARRAWPVAAAEVSVAREELALWQPLLAQVDYFENAKFYIVRGRFAGADRDEYEADVGFSGTARMKSGELHWIKGDQIVRWRRHPSDAGDDWRISAWLTRAVKTMESRGPLFREVLDEVLPANDLMRARRSIHEEHVLAYLLDPENFEPPHEYFFPAAVDRHPAVAVVDIDRDGYDDIFVAERLTTTMLFHNRGDGTFEERAADFGLAIDDYVSAAIFADFDNDGDSDAILGRTLQPSLYLENDGGRFVDRSAEVFSGRLPSLVSSVNAVDYDNDGLLDVYFSTYAAQIIEANEHRLREVLGAHLGDAEIAALDRALRDDDLVKSMNFPGPPNVLLKNVGGARFERETASPALAVGRNTYQSTWSDFDGDGDADVYVANDFSPNNMLRNDGDGRFVDVTESTGTADIGFGMGASWGDYDDDGRHDLYVSNMFSKAGQRITEQIGVLDPRWSQMARGNSLFKNDGDAFVKVSGQSEPALTVEKAGWSWGSQFADVDNDSFLDIYALSGHYTAPQPVRSEADR